jgi:peptide/nickel transport system permease protein
MRILATPSSFGLAKFAITRALRATLVVLGVSLLCFVLLQAAPGDFVSEMRINPQISESTVSALRHQYGLDQSFWIRYVKWLASVVRGDLGFSFAYSRPVAPMLVERCLNTLLLSGSALVVTWLIALPLGIWSASHRGKWRDTWLTGASGALHTVPDVLFAILLLMFAVRTGWFPAGGMQSLEAGTSHSWDVLKHLFLPVMALVLANVPTVLRHVRAAMAETLSEPFVRTAESQGIPRVRLLWRHALPASSNPLTTLFGLSVASLLSSSLLVEVIMSWPGLGPFFLEAVFARDVHVVLGAVMASTLFLLAGLAIADGLLMLLDPRVRMTELG